MTSLRGPRPRVGVASDQKLIAESVQVALRDRGFDPVPVEWPTVDGEAAAASGRRGDGPASGVEVGLVLSELDTATRVHQARVLVREQPTRWLVLTGAPRGETWGALIEAGAVAVVPTGRTLDDVVEQLQRMAGSRPADAPEPVDESSAAAQDSAESDQVLVHEWIASCLDGAGAAHRLATLTPRERQVLEHLHQGSGVGTIALTSGVTVGTVRSQVKSVLRKLGVNSQLAAVAVFEDQVLAVR